MEFRTTTMLKVYTGEDVYVNGEPLYKCVMKKAMELGLAGGTVVKGIAGYAAKKRGMGRAVNTLISGNSNMPIIIEIVDSRESLEPLLSFLETHATQSFVTIEDCTYLVTDYIRQKEAGKK